MENSILIVDDKPEVAKIIMLYLSNYEVAYKENPILAIEWLKSGNRPDLIISDLNMPEMNGEEFLIYLKNDKMLKTIPVVILSSVDNSSSRARLFEEGVEDFILKPFNPQELKIRIRRFLQ